MTEITFEFVLVPSRSCCPTNFSVRTKPVAAKKEKEKKKSPGKQAKYIEDGKTKSGRNPQGKQNECEINRSAQKYACDPAETKVQKKLETKSKTHIMVQAHKLT